MAQIASGAALHAGALGLGFLQWRSDAMSDSDRVLILGGGLAGLAAASVLAPLGFRVTMLEARDRLGGRASSFHDPQSGQLIDNCQHVNMGCCTNFAHFCRTTGIDRYLEPLPCLYFMTPDGKVSLFRGADFPTPLHLARSFLTLHTLSSGEKVRAAYGLARLRLYTAETDPPFLPWLQRHGQTQRIIDRFWGLVLVSALNETPDRIGLRYARKVFVDGFLTHPKGFEVQIPSVPLGQLYGGDLSRWLEKHRVDVRFQQSVKTLQIAADRVEAVELRGGEQMDADWIVSALPFSRLLQVVPETIRGGHAYFQGMQELETSPITSVHVWFDRPVLDLPHVVLVDCLGQWVFAKGETADGEHYLQIVVSAARELRAQGNEMIGQRIVEELRGLFPKAKGARVLRSRVVTEHAATFSAVPGVDRWRPKQMSPVANLLVAGDWTDTGWPATMEGAVRSGYLAAEALLAKKGKRVRLVRPDL
jgi:squalene-associated FAD-dependent desaturase